MLRRAPGAVYEQLGDATLVLDAEHGTYVRLNGTGAFLWEALAEPVEEAALVRALSERHGIDETRARARARGRRRDPVGSPPMNDHQSPEDVPPHTYEAPQAEDVETLADLSE